MKLTAFRVRFWNLNYLIKQESAEFREFKLFQKATIIFKLEKQVKDTGKDFISGKKLTFDLGFLYINFKNFDIKFLWFSMKKNFNHLCNIKYLQWFRRWFIRERYWKFHSFKSHVRLTFSVIFTWNYIILFHFKFFFSLYTFSFVSLVYYILTIVFVQAVYLVF